VRLTTAEEVFREAYAAGWSPPPLFTVSEWAEAHIVLPPEVSNEPGPWRTARVPYLREPMDRLSESDPSQKLVLMFAAQTAKTSLINNAIGYAIDHAPGPMLFVMPTSDMARGESKQRLAPLIEASAALRAKVLPPRSRDSGNTILMKEFPGGFLLMAGANSPTGLRRMPARYVFLDEVDGYPGDVGGAERGEGDPVSLAEKRATTFSRRKIVLTSTPSVKGISRIEDEFLATDQRRYYVPCPHCGNMDWIRWENIRWPKADPAAAELACLACAKLIPEHHKQEMLAAGEWRPTVEEPASETLGYHLSALYSPLGWKSWAECVSEFLAATSNPLKLKVWVNTVLAETFEERGDSVDPTQLANRLETYEADVPAGVGVLVCAVDVQGDRLEAQVVGFGAGEESWLIAFTQIHGDPSREPSGELPGVWFELHEFLLQEFVHQSGRKMRIECTTVDSGGHHTEEVYRFCRPRLNRRVFAVKGGSERGKPVLPARPSDRNQYRAKLWTLCVDTAKEIVFSRLRIGTRGPGYVHFPDWTDEEYLAQLTAEKAVRRWVKGRGTVREWIKLRERNEALDLWVYTVAALLILGPGLIRSLPERASAFARPLEEDESAEADPTPRARRRRKNWVAGWR
jgi:phage terminase large subunit GpA-like protein